jgi:hypothetical protein
MTNCTHLNGQWEWTPHGCTLVPAYSIRCTDCKALLFTTIFDADKKEHRIGIPDSSTAAWQKYILNAFRKRFPEDTVVLAT